MDEQTKQLIKYGAMAAAAYFVYQWLQNSGLWAQWFGVSSASNSFNNSAALLAYCHANPNGTAIYVNPANGQSSTATCAQWIASNSQAAVPAVSPGSGLAPNYQQAISLMQQAAGNDSQNIDGWAYYWQNGAIFDGAPTGFGVSGSITGSQIDQLIKLNGGNRSTPLSAEHFVAWMAQMGSQEVTPAAMVTGGGGAGMMGYDFGGMYSPESDWVN